MNKIGKIAHNISVRNTSQNDFIKIEITPSVFNIFARTPVVPLLPLSSKWLNCLDWLLKITDEEYPII